MFGRSASTLFAVTVILQSAACIFFHEPSATLLIPSGSPTLTTDKKFGLTIGYFNNRIIVGSPNSNLDGEVYKCPVNEISDNKLNCSVLGLDLSLSPYTREGHPDQKFCLGGSIATTKNYLFTCAPLVTKWVSDETGTLTVDAVGSCFITNTDDTSTPYVDPGARFDNKTKKTKEGANLYRGGAGWTTLSDEDNDFLIVAKSAGLSGDINYLPVSEPNKTMTSLIETSTHTTYMKNLKEKLWNTGYGISAGKFFSKSETVYAFSTQFLSEGTNMILFLKPNGAKLELMTTKKNNVASVYELKNQAMGSMYGYALGAADLLQHGLSVLLVGAPLQCNEDENDLERGALHINLWKENENKDNVALDTVYTIQGNVERGRFATAISTSDIDGDGIPEVFVSAPYESSGVVYILSGQELQMKLLAMKTDTYRRARIHSESELVSKLKYTQKLTSESSLKWSEFGFSLTVMPDLDSNGCNDIAIGAPKASSVVLLKCLQTVRIAVSSSLVSAVSIDDKSFAVKVCLEIEYLTGNTVTGHIIVKHSIDGSGSQTSFIFDLSLKEKSHCENITVNIQSVSLEHELKTMAELQEINNYTSSKDFQTSWVKLHSHSKTQYKLPIKRFCRANQDCTPHLSLEVRWKNEPVVKEDASDYAVTTYEADSSRYETVSVVVKNVGVVTANGQCVTVEVSGNTVARAENCLSKSGYSECLTVNSLQPNYESPFDIVLPMTELSNLDIELFITARMFDKEDCDQKTKVKLENKLKIKYLFGPAWEKVQLQGEKHDFSISDHELTKDALQKKSIFKDDQQYSIVNNGLVTWKNVEAEIVVERRPFLIKVQTENCTVSEEESQYKISCSNLTLLPGETKKIIASVEMSGNKLGEDLNREEKINVSSKITLQMMSSQVADPITKDLVTQIVLKKEVSFKNNPIGIIVVAVIVGISLLAFIVFCLYKKGFFTRKEKKKMDVLRESIRRRSVRLSSVRSKGTHASPSTAEDNDHFDIEVIDDSPFEEVPISSNDDAVLVKSQVEVHTTPGEEKKIGS